MLTIQDEKIIIQDLGRQPIFVFHQGNARLRLDYRYYLHHFNISSVKLQVRQLRAQFETLESNQFTDLIIEKLNELNFAFKSIDPIKRRKRWNSLGTAWKFIAGNPDANDLKIINSSINNLIINNNEQIKINREVNLQLKEAIFKTKKALSMFNQGSIEIYCIKILFHLNYLLEKLNQIIETITLAKIGLLNENVLSQREIEILVTDLARENITVHTAIEATTYATTSIASNNQEIALLIKMPKLDPRIFTKVRILPILQDSKKIHLPNQYYLINDGETYQINSIQPTIFGKHEIYPDNSTCIPKLLRGNPAVCNFTSNPVVENVIHLDDRHIFINAIANFTLSSNCGISDRNLSGSFIITFKNCNLLINNVLYSSTTQTLPGNVIQLPLDGLNIKKHREILNISLDHLHKLHLETRKELEFIRLSSGSISWPHWSVLGGISSTPLIICLVVLCYLMIRRRAKYQTPSIILDQESLREVQPTIRRLTIREVVRTEPHLSGGTS